MNKHMKLLMLSVFALGMTSTGLFAGSSKVVNMSEVDQEAITVGDVAVEAFFLDALIDSEDKDEITGAKTALKDRKKVLKGLNRDAMTEAEEESVEAYAKQIKSAEKELRLKKAKKDKKSEE